MPNLSGNSGGGGGASAEEAVPAMSWPPETFDTASGDEDSLMGLTNSG